MKEFLLSFSIEELILWIVLFLFFLIQVLYYLIVFGKVAFRKSPVEQAAPQPVSVIICARNEAENLEAHLPIIMEQEYFDYEVIIVDDCSVDDTEDVLKRFKNIYPHLRSTAIKQDEKFVHGKKLAMTIGIKAAKNEWLLFTDADCMPENRQWISTMQTHFTDNKNIVLGYGGYKSLKGFLNKLIRYDTFFIALQYLGFAMTKMPYMGVGRNLAYRKSLFIKNKGFASHHHLFSGDDDLFVNEVANKNNTKVEIDPKSYTRTLQKTSFMDWFWQKGRHLTTSKKYQFKHKVMLMLEPLSRMLFYSLFASLIVLGIFPIFVVSAFFIRLLIQLSIIKLTMKRLHEEDLLLSSLLFDVALPFIYIALGLTNLFIPKPRKWK